MLHAELDIILFCDPADIFCHVEFFDNTAKLSSVRLHSTAPLRKGDHPGANVSVKEPFFSFEHLKLSALGDRGSTIAQTRAKLMETADEKKRGYTCAALANVGESCCCSSGECVIIIIVIIYASYVQDLSTCHIYYTKNYEKVVKFSRYFRFAVCER